MGDNGRNMHWHLSSRRAPGASAVFRRTALFALLFAFPIVAAPASAQLSLGKLTATPTPASTQPNPAPAATPAAPATPQPIPLPDVPTRAEDLKRILRGIQDQLPTREAIAQVKSDLDDRDEPLQVKQRELQALLTGTASSLEVREQENYWRNVERDCADARRQLLGWANVAQAALQQLQQQAPEWKATLAANQSTPDLGPTLDLIRSSVRDITTAQKEIEDSLRVLVNLQVRAADQDQLALDAVQRLARARAQLNGRLLERDSLPLWQVIARRQAGEAATYGHSPRMIGVRSFFDENRYLTPILLVLWLLSEIAAYRLFRDSRRWQAGNEEELQVVRIGRFWYAVGLLPPLLFGYLLAPVAPLTVIGAFILASFIPILLLLPPLVQPGSRKLLYCAVALYAFNVLVQLTIVEPSKKRELVFLSMLAGVIIFATLIWRSRKTPAGKISALLSLGVQLSIVVMAGALAANLAGYVKLAQFLGYLCVYSTLIAVAVITGLRVFTLLLQVGLGRPGAEQIAAVRLHRAAIVRWVPRVMTWAGLLLWMGATLELLGIRGAVNNIIESVFEFPIAGSASKITLGSVLGFFVILLVGYAVSSSIRFLLREELLKRMHLSRGLPELIASTIHYLLLLLVFFFAVNLGNVELNKFTLLTGALGVGVGFGLQNIVNNFISGLILQFERPIHIGDVLDIDGSTGTVTRIGIRSSTILTFQGAEVIIPNGTFISGKVVNWTLTEPKRRVELPVGVAYGSNVKQVRELLAQAAVSHESVLTEPAPIAYFKGFGDSSLDFELQFWVMQESNVTRVKSEVALTAMQSFDDANIEIPFPQRDLRLRSVDPAAAEALSGDANQSDQPLRKAAATD